MAYPDLLPESLVQAYCAPLLAHVGDAIAPAAVETIVSTATRATVRRFEREAMTYLRVRRIVQRPHSSQVKGRDYDIEESPLDFRTGDFDHIPTWRLRKRPVRSVERIRIAAEQDKDILLMPGVWFQIQHRLGLVSLLPLGAAQPEITGWPAWVIKMFIKGVPAQELPQLLCIDYTVGWYADDEELPEELEEAQDVLAAEAHARALRALSGIIPSSVNLGRFSQQFQDVASRLADAEKRTSEFIAAWRRTNNPSPVTVI